MDKKTASKLWVALNSGEKPKELEGVPLTTHDEVWEQMEKLRPLASESEVNRIWAEKNGLDYAAVALPFGHP